MYWNALIKTHIKYLYSSITLLILGTPTYSQLRADFTADKTGGCSPLIVSFTNTTTGASSNVTYSWDFGNGNSAAVANPSAVYHDESVYTITLTVRDGSQTSVATKQITVYSKPAVDFSASAVKGCLPAPVTFTSNSNPGSGSLVSYHWDFGDGYTTQAFSNSTTHVYSIEQKATVSLTAVNSFGCYSTLVKKDMVEIIPALTAAFTADKRILCLETDPVRFTNNSAGPGTLTYLWDFGDGNTSTAKDPSYAFNKKGIYTVKLTVNSSEGCTATSNQSNYLNVASYNADFDVPALICKGSTANFVNKGTPYPNNPVWEIDGVPNYYYTDYFSYTFNTPGTHTVRLTNTFGSCTQSVARQVTVRDIPDLKGFVTEITGQCGAPTPVNFKDTTPTAVKWEWDFAYNYSTPRISSNEKTPAYTYTNDGYYNVFLRVTNTEGCTNTAIKTVQTIKPYVTISGTNTTTTCGPVTTKFSVYSAEEIVSYKWVFGDGGTSTDANPEHTFVKVGTYQIRLDYTTKNGCTGSAYMNSVTVYSKPEVDFIAAPGTTVCGNTGVTFNATVSGLAPGEYLFWYWDFGDNSYAGSGPGVVHNYFGEGTYSVKLIVRNGYCTDTAYKQDYIKVLSPFPRFNGAANTCDGTRGDVTFTQYSRNATSVVWDFGDGSPTITTPGDQVEIKHTYTRSGSFPVSVTAINDQCSVKDVGNATVLLRQKPQLTAAKTAVCLDDVVPVKLLNYENNPRTATYGPGYSMQFQYDDGTNFDGSLYYNNNYWTNIFDGSLANFKRNQQNLRVITTSFGFGCKDTSNYIPITLKGVMAGFEPLSEKACFNNAITFRDTSKSLTSSIQTWRWDFGDGQTQTMTQGGTISHLYDNPGYYYVTLKVSDNTGCTSTTTSTTRAIIINGPKASFNASGTNVPLSTTVYFYNTTNNGGDAYYNSKYEWQVNGVTFSNDYTPSYKFDDPGTYTIKLIATNPTTNCSSEYTQVIVVKEFNSAFSFSTSFVTAKSCPPVLARFTNNSVNYTRVTWDFGDGVTAGNLYAPTHIYEKPGKYIITLSVYGPNGLKGQYIDSVIISQPEATIKTDAKEGCTGYDVTISAAAKNAISYTWDFGDGSVLQTSDPNAAHKYNTPGTYSPVLLVTDAGNCTSPAKLPGKIIVRPDPVINISPADPRVCLGASLSLNASGGVSYSWTPATGLNNTQVASPLASPLNNTTYTVKVADDIGCTNTKAIAVEVVQPVNVQVSENTKVCAGNTVQLLASGASIYNWINNTAGLSSTQIANPLAMPAATTTYTVTGSDAYKCFTDTAEVTVRILPLPTVNAGQDVEALAGTPVLLNAAGSSDITRWSWSPAQYLSCTDCPDPVANPLSQIIYAVTVINADRCTAKDSIQIKMLCEETRVYIPNSFTPNGNTKNDVFMIKGISMIRHMLIFNRWGEKIFERSNFIASDRSNCWDGTYKNNPAPTGAYVYFIEMQCPAGGVFTRKGSFVLIR